MGLGSFYWEVIKRAFSGRFWYAEKISGGFALFLGIGVAVYFRDWESALNWLPFAVFATVFVSALVFGLLVAPHRIYLEELEKNSQVKNQVDSLRKFVASHDRFTLEESACLIAGHEIRQADIVGPASGYLRTLQERAISGRLQILNDPNDSIKLHKMVRGIGMANSDRLRAGYEISKVDLAKLAAEFDSAIPGLTDA